MRRVAPDAASACCRIAGELGKANLAHAPEWCTVIRQAYGHDPLYLTAEDDDGPAGLLPAFIIRRPLFGAVVSSMPFLDAGGPCCASASLGDALVERLIGEAQRAGARAVELRCTQKLGSAWQATEHKVNLTLALPADADRLWRRLDRSVRSQVRKAERSGLWVEFGGVEKLACFYDIFAARMRDLGSPVHAAGFFRAVLDSFGDRARIGLIRKGDMPVGGLVALVFKDRVAVPWASCRKEYFPLCPNMLLYWEILRRACAEGPSRFDFGRSTRGSGTYHFKRQWGAEEEPLFWYTIPLAPGRRPLVSNTGQCAALLAKAWQRLPLPVTRRFGPSIRRYLTQ